MGTTPRTFQSVLDWLAGQLASGPVSQPFGPDTLLESLNFSSSNLARFDATLNAVDREFGVRLEPRDVARFTVVAQLVAAIVASGSGGEMQKVPTSAVMLRAGSGLDALDDKVYYSNAVNLLTHYSNVRAALLPTLLTIQIGFGTYYFTFLLDKQPAAVTPGGRFVNLWFLSAESVLCLLAVLAVIFIGRSRRVTTRYIRKLEAGRLTPSSKVEDRPFSYLVRTAGIKDRSFPDDKLSIAWDYLVVGLSVSIWVICLMGSLLLSR